MLRVLDLFAGIGGFSLGLERTGGFETVAFCEIDKKAQLVLKKHWPNVHVYEDIKELSGERLQADGIVPDVITGGFPCQDISNAGKGKGIIGERSGLWSEMFRLIRDVRPAWAIIENVSALRSKGLTLVLQDLCSVGYCAEWHCIPASAVGAPHQRDRIWIVAYPHVVRCEKRHPECSEPNKQEQANHVVPCCPYVADSNEPRLERWLRTGLQECTSELLTGAGSSFKGELSDQWRIEPEVGRVADGVPNRVDRLKQLGNSVVPQIPELLGRAILSTVASNGG